jgi:hypothetical protein
MSPENSSSNLTRLTHADDDLVAPLEKLILIVAPIQLRECRKTGSAHPILKAFVHMEIGRWCIICITIREPRRPIGRGDNLREIIGKGLGIFIGLAWPSDALLREVISRGSSRWRVQ